MVHNREMDLMGFSAIYEDEVKNSKCKNVFGLFTYIGTLYGNLQCVYPYKNVDLILIRHF